MLKSLFSPCFAGAEKYFRLSFQIIGKGLDRIQPIARILTWQANDATPKRTRTWKRIMATTVRIIGNTKAVKDTLKKDGYKWNAEKSRWYQSFSDTHAEWLLSEETRDATLTSFRMKYKGCQVLVGEVVVFTSKTYSDATASPADSGLVLDLEDGMWKRRSECDIPAN